MASCPLSQQFSNMVRSNETHHMSVSVVERQTARLAAPFEVSISHFTLDTRLNFSGSGKEAPLYADVKEGFSNLADGKKFTKEVKGDNRTRTYIVEGTRHGDEINVRVADITDGKSLLGTGFISDINGLFDNSRFSIKNISNVGSSGISLDPSHSIRLTVNYDDRFTGRRSALTVIMPAGTTAEEAARKVLDLLGIRHRTRTNEFGRWIELMDGSERFGGLQYYFGAPGGRMGIPFMRGTGGSLFFVSGANIVFDRDATFSLVNEAATSNLGHPGTDFRYLGNLRVLYSELDSYTGQPPPAGFSFSTNIRSPWGEGSRPMRLQNAVVAVGHSAAIQLQRTASEAFGFWYVSRFLSRTGALQARQDLAVPASHLLETAGANFSPQASLQPPFPEAQGKKTAVDRSGSAQLELLHAAEVAVQIVELQSLQALHREKSSFAQASGIQVEPLSAAERVLSPHEGAVANVLKPSLAERNANAAGVGRQNANAISNAGAVQVAAAQRVSLSESAVQIAGAQKSTAGYGVSQSVAQNISVAEAAQALSAPRQSEAAKAAMAERTAGAERAALEKAVSAPLRQEAGARVQTGNISGAREREAEAGAQALGGAVGSAGNPAEAERSADGEQMVPVEASASKEREPAQLAQLPLASAEAVRLEISGKLKVRAKRVKNEKRRAMDSALSGISDIGDGIEIEGKRTAGGKADAKKSASEMQKAPEEKIAAQCPENPNPAGPAAAPSPASPSASPDSASAAAQIRESVAPKKPELVEKKKSGRRENGKIEAKKAGEKKKKAA